MKTDCSLTESCRSMSRFQENEKQPSFILSQPLVMASLARVNAFFTGKTGGFRVSAPKPGRPVPVTSRHSKLHVTAQGNGRFIVGGNWKCNGTKASVEALVKGLNAGDIADKVDVVVAPPFLYIDQAMGALHPKFKVAAQNAWVEYTLDDPTHHYDSESGAFTGEVSAEMLEDLQIPWVILGHSERRSLLNEDNKMVGKKVAHARFHGLSVIVCVGETLEERESEKTLEVIFAQLQAVADEIDDREHSSWGSQVVIAYEPIWAIGTGKVATPDQVQDVHAAIREWLKLNVSEEVSKATRIQYGGSVNETNCAELARFSDVDGFLVGGASLDPEKFVQICNSSVVHYKAVGRA
jgi:triosephosphate isomerase|tara:strand:+ start:168 stop:1223 length:1056 start_codon:yes stop_codon:yes gene_type:complete